MQAPFFGGRVHVGIAMEWLLQLLMIRTRIAFRWRNRGRRRLNQTVLRALRQRLEEATRAEVPQYVTIYNAGLFFVLVEQDISAYSECITFARSEWQRQFFARGLAILLYEAAEDIPQVFGGHYRKCIGEFEDGTGWLKRLNSIASQFNQFRVNRSEFLGKVRNLIGAHRDHNAIAQLHLMGELKSIEVYKLAAEFSTPLRQLTDYYVDLLPHMHSPRVMIQQVVKATVARGAMPKNANHA
jgi:hypothetical protein